MNGVFQSCDTFTTLCPSETEVHTFQCIVSSSTILWEVFSNGALVYSYTLNGLAHSVGTSQTNGNFTFVLTQNGGSNVKSIANVSNLNTGSVEGDRLRCTDGVDAQSKTCNLVLQGNYNNQHILIS